MRTIDNLSAVQSMKETENNITKPRDIRDKVAAKGMQVAVLGEYLEDTDGKYDEFQIPVSNEVRDWHASQTVDELDTDISPVEGGEMTGEDIYQSEVAGVPELPHQDGYHIEDGEYVIGEDIDELPEELSDVLDGPDDNR